MELLDHPAGRVDRPTCRLGREHLGTRSACGGPRSSLVRRPFWKRTLAGLIGLNREAWHASREGWDAMHGLLAPVRRELLRDPLAAFRKAMDTAPPTDRAVMDDPEWQRVLIED